MNKEEFIRSELISGKLLKEIGNSLGVSRQRIYQLMTRYNISTPERRKKNFWKSKSLEHKWLWKALCHKLEFGVTAEQRWELFNELKNIPTKCPILGIRLDFSEKNNIRIDSSPSIDCVNPEKGYISGNLKIISWRANRIKNDGTAEEHEKIAKYISQHIQDLK